MLTHESSWIVFDIETAGRADAPQYLKPVKADGRLTNADSYLQRVLVCR